MIEASLALDPDFRVAPVQRRTFGSFVEHMGRCVYTGIFELDHEQADEEGFRKDVLELVREMGVSVVRYPGGNFVSGYRWEDGVGPVDQRPERLDLAWHTLEPNTFGVGEFISWTRKAGIEPMMAMNLGTRGVQEARELLEYCNHPGGSYWSDLRISHGHREPFGIKMWCLGNELDGPWQQGHKTPYEYGRLAAETARVMRMLDPNLELVACGSSSREMPTFPSWEATVLEECYDQVDFISAHNYYWEEDGDLGSFLASAMQMEAFIEEVVATADHVRAKVRSPKRINVSFDEWNVWYLPDFQKRREEADQNPNRDWPKAPPLSEDPYNVADAVVVGSLLITLLRHSDRVTAACQAQLVNTIAPMCTEPGGPAWRKTIYYPFAQVASLARGAVLRVEPTTPMYENAKFGETPVIHTVATHDEDSGEVVVFAVNRDQSESVALSLGLRAFPGVRVAEHLVVADDDLRAQNTQEQPDRVVPRNITGAQHSDGAAQVELPPVSWNVIRLTPVGP